MISRFKLRDKIELPQEIKNIPSNIYGQALGRFRIVTIETAVFNKDGKMLLIKRNEDPVSGEWWICGTRLIGGESIVEGAQRALKKELDLEIDQERIKVDDKVQFIDWPISPKAPFGENLLHCIAHVEITEKEVGEIKLKNQEHINKQWLLPGEVAKNAEQFLPPLVDICNFFRKDSL